MTDILKIEDGVLHRCNDKTATNVTIPDGVTKIGEGAFLYCTSLESVVIPDSVTKIGVGAFRACTSLSSVVIPNSVTKIGDEAFMECTSLSLVLISDSVTEIGRSAFNDCKSLKSVEIPNSVTKIGAWAFANCNINELSHPCLTIKNGAVIKDNTFLYSASQLSSITIPDCITQIGVCAFSSCESLSYVKIPNSVTQIGDFAFTNCSKLLSLEIPDSVIEIGEDAFYGCKSLSTVTLGDDFEKVPSEWFDSLNEANANYEIVCTEGSSTYKAIKRSAKLKTHIKEIALQIAKDEKIAQVKKTGASSVLSSLLSVVVDSSFEILSNTKSATVVRLKIAKNIGVFKLGADCAKWLPKIQKVIEAFSDSTKSGEDIFCVIQEQKLPLAEIPSKCGVFKADCNGSLNLFASGVLKIKGYECVKNLALFGITKIGEHALYRCKSLESVEISCSATEISKCAFSWCKSLSSVFIPTSVKKIGRCTFIYSTALKEVRFGGTVAQWEAVEKGEEWNDYIPAKCVKCADGEASL